MCVGELVYTKNPIVKSVKCGQVACGRLGRLPVGTLHLEAWMLQTRKKEKKGSVFFFWTLTSGQKERKKERKKELKEKKERKKKENLQKERKKERKIIERKVIERKKERKKETL